MEIYNSFEIDYKIVNDKIQINMEYLHIKQDQCKLFLFGFTNTEHFGLLE